MTREQIASKTRSSLKRKKEELITNAPIKKARIQVMKALANKYKDSCKINKDKINNFTEFYKVNKDIYPWLRKESLRWHIREDIITDTTSTKLQKTNQNILQSFNTNQSQVRT